MATQIGPTRDLGPCQVWYGGSQVGTAWDGVTVRFTDNDAPVYEAEHGETPVDAVHIGQGQVEVTVPLTRLSLADLTIVVPGGTTTVSGMKVVNDRVGVSEYDNAQELILKPIQGNSTASDQYWFHVPKAYPLPDMEISFNTRDQRVYNVTFKGFPDADTGVVWHIGNLT